MRRAVVVLFLLVLTGVPLAGCLDAESESKVDVPNGGDDPKDPGGSDDRPGGIEGLVADASFAPIEDATVELVQEGSLLAEARTLENGSYAFEDLDPGEYRLRFSASCCKGDARAAIVEAGKVTKVTVNLEPIRTNEPYVDRLVWDGLVGCSLFIPEYGVYFNPEGACAESDPNNDPIHDVVLQPGLATIVVAMEWDQVTSNPTNDLQLVMSKGPFIDSRETNRFFSLNGDSPLEVTVGPEGAQGGEDLYFGQIDEEWEAEFTVTASSSGGFAYQQPFTVHYEFHYWDPAPDGASALPE